MQRPTKEVDRQVFTCLSRPKYPELCWKMVCHSPPIHLEWNYTLGHSFDLQMLRSLTLCRDVVDYMIWPVIFLHKDSKIPTVPLK